jgi:hypothetical protein
MFRQFIFGVTLAAAAALQAPSPPPDVDTCRELAQLAHNDGPALYEAARRCQAVRDLAHLAGIFLVTGQTARALREACDRSMVARSRSCGRGVSVRRCVAAKHPSRPTPPYARRGLRAPEKHRHHQGLYAGNSAAQPSLGPRVFERQIAHAIIPQSLNLRKDTLMNRQRYARGQLRAVTVPFRQSLSGSPLPAPCAKHDA